MLVSHTVQFKRSVTFLLAQLRVYGGSKGVGLQHLDAVAQSILATVYPLLHIWPKHLHPPHSGMVSPAWSCKP